MVSAGPFTLPAVLQHEYSRDISRLRCFELCAKLMRPVSPAAGTCSTSCSAGLATGPCCKGNGVLQACRPYSASGGSYWARQHSEGEGHSQQQGSRADRKSGTPQRQQCLCPVRLLRKGGCAQGGLPCAAHMAAKSHIKPHCHRCALLHSLHACQPGAQASIFMSRSRPTK